MSALGKVAGSQRFHADVRHAVRAFGAVSEDPRIQQEAGLHTLALRFAHEAGIPRKAEGWRQPGVEKEYFPLATTLAMRRKEVAVRLVERLPQAQVYLPWQEL